MDWLTLAGRLLELVLRIIDQNQKNQLDQSKLDLIIMALKEPPPPKEPAP